MMRTLRRWTVGLSMGSLAALSGADCADSSGSYTDGGGYYLDGGGYYNDSWSGGDYYYGWYEDGSTSSFSLYPGSDPGDSLETYLGNSVIY